MGSAITQQQASRAAFISHAEKSDAPHAPPLMGLDLVHSAIAGRVNVSPKRLIAPGPSAQQLEILLAMAAAAPDHGHLLPWRFVLIPQEQRHRLGDAFVSALIARDPSATQEQLASAEEKAHRSPLLLLAIACLGDSVSGVPEFERIVSLGAAIQNMLVSATAMGFGSGLSSGQAMDSVALRALFQLGTNESALCFVNIGTFRERKASKRVRPKPCAILSTLGC